MNVKDFFEKTKINKTAFCERVGISSQYLYQIITGRSIPSYAIAKKISEETDNQVSIEELCINKETKIYKKAKSIEQLGKKLDLLEQGQKEILFFLEENFKTLQKNVIPSRKIEKSNGKSLTFEGEKEISEEFLNR